MTGVKLVVEGPPLRVGPLPKCKIIRFSPLYFRGVPLGHRLGPLDPRIGPLRLKNDPWRPDMGPLRHVNGLFSLNFDIEKLQYSIVRIENGPP